MGTANFASPENAEHYYVILDNYEDEETGEVRSLESWEIEDFDDNMENDLSELAADGWQFSAGSDHLKDYSRNYEKTAFGKFYISKQFGDVEVGINIIPLRQNGYYEGATLDYNIEYSGYSDDEYDDLDEMLEDSFSDYYSEMNAGLRTIQKRNAKKWLEPTLTEFREKLEAFYASRCNIKLGCMGRMSNGEAIYQKVE